jgi:hypothetical protein
MENTKYIINPNTGKVVKADGKIGKSILEKKTKKQQEMMFEEFEERKRIREMVAKCPYGTIYSTKKGGKCIDRKSEEGVEVVECQKKVVQDYIHDFKRKKTKAKTYKQALAISLSESQTKC